MDPDEYKAYRESFEDFDWNKNGRISHTSLQVNYYFLYPPKLVKQTKTTLFVLKYPLSPLLDMVFLK